jgi:hypothetical protein
MGDLLRVLEAEALRSDSGKELSNSLYLSVESLVLQINFSFPHLEIQNHTPGPLTSKLEYRASNQINRQTSYL